MLLHQVAVFVDTGPTFWCAVWGVAEYVHCVARACLACFNMDTAAGCCSMACCLLLMVFTLQHEHC
jgi:hypothetical protein